MQIKHILLYLAVLALAALFRFGGMYWDANAHLHPDERFLTMVTTNISLPNNIREYFDTKNSPANPHNKEASFYVYGTYPVHLTKLVAGLLHKDTYDDRTPVSRGLSAVVDLLTLIVVFLMATFLGKNAAAGLFAAFFYAVMVTPIQLSHFYTVDPYATLFLTISLYRLVRGKFDLWLGVAFGLAVAAKISSILFLPIILIAFIQGHSLARARGGLMKFMQFTLAFFATVRIFYPYLFVGWKLNPLVLNNWKELKGFDGSSTGFPPALQWFGVPFWQPTLDMLVWGIGIPLGIVFICAIIYFMTHPQKHKNVLLLVVWILLLLSYQSMQFAKAMRYLWPIYPAIAVLCGLFLSRIRFTFLLALPVLLALLIWPFAFISIYHAPHTRIAASRWIYDSIPKGATIAWEHWDDPLPLSVKNHSIGEFKTIQLPMYNPDSKEKWQELSSMIANTDYIVLSSNRVYGGTGRARDRFPETTRYYSLLFANQLGFEKIAEFVSRPALPFPKPLCVRIPGFFYGTINPPTCQTAGIQFVDDYAEESFTVYDHPKVTIYINKERKTQEELYTLIINRQQ